jgi:O-antigen ligase/polysaccharide polymerase Wzy-like membrane protein
VRTPYLSGRLAPAGGSLSALADNPSAAIPATVVLGAILGVILVAKPILVLLLFALALAAVGVVLAFVRPDLAFGGLVLLLGLVPTYAAPQVGPIFLLPAALGSWGIAVALLWRNMVAKGYLLRWNYVDLAALTFFVLMAVSLNFSPRTELHDYVHEVFFWIGPYFGARLLLADVESPVRVAAISFALVTVILAPIAVAEAFGSSNPFFNLNFNPGEFELWARQINRFGATRAVTSWGHPISFSIFLAASALLSFAMGIASKGPKYRSIWYGAAVIATGTMTLTLSRTGWVMLAIGIVLLALTTRGVVRARLFALIGAIVGVVLFMAIVTPDQLGVLPGFSHAHESHYETSGLYREALLRRALEPGVLHPWGNLYNQVTPAVGYDKATDNAYIILADTWGLIPTFALFAVGASMLVAVARSYGSDDELIAILPIAAFTTLVAIFFVAFITQQPVLIWLLVGAGGTAAERVSAARRRAPPLSRG